MSKIVSRLLILSPESQYSPSYLARTASSIGRDIYVKQTCYGVLLEGTERDVEYAVKELRKIDPDKIFSKTRAFPLGDKRRCRAERGGARPGFYFLEKEIELLPNVTKGLECLGQREQKIIKKRKKIDPKDFINIIKKMEVKNDKDN